jgi:SPP1 gp7 family putative phage head morphogenesis protein
LNQANSYDEAKDNLTEELFDREFILSLSSHLGESMVTMNALGRSFVVQKDRHFSSLQKQQSAKFAVGKYFASAVGMNWFAAQDSNVRVTFDLVPQEVLRYLQQKGLRIAGVENQEILDAVKRKLVESLERGLSYNDFKRDVRIAIDSIGYTGDQPFRLHTVYTTNMYSAYTIGQLEQVNEVRDRFPMWRYVAILDNRTAPLDRRLNGRIFRVGEGPIPPIHFNCRCTTQPIHIYEAERDSLQPVGGDELNGLLEGKSIIRFDNEAEFQRWYTEKLAGLDPRIKNIVQ